MNNNFLINLGKNIKSFRELNKLSQHQLAKLVNVSNVAVSQWEKGISDPKSSNIVALSKIFKISVDDLLNIKNESFNHTFDFIKIEKTFNNAQFTEDNNLITIQIKK